MTLLIFQCQHCINQRGQQQKIKADVCCCCCSRHDTLKDPSRDSHTHNRQQTHECVCVCVLAYPVFLPPFLQTVRIRVANRHPIVQTFFSKCILKSARYPNFSPICVSSQLTRISMYFKFSSKSKLSKISLIMKFHRHSYAASLHNTGVWEGRGEECSSKGSIFIEKKIRDRFASAVQPWETLTLP